ncbi:unnamed protein product [Calypogeia fissa]
MREGMADLFVLLQDLGDRIANKGDVTGSTQHDEDDAVESRFRSVLPTLLERSFVSGKVKERELLAILKLLRMMVKHYPGVFYHGEGRSVLPILSYIIPLFAEWELRACHEGLFETWVAFVFLLQAGERKTYQKMFMDGMILVQDLVSIASFFSSPSSISTGRKVSLQCYLIAYSGLSSWRECRTPAGGMLEENQGLVVDVPGQVSWQPLAEWTVKLLRRCLQEGALHVEGLLTASFISAVAALMCYGNSSLQMACFDFICVATSVMDMETFPSERLIMSLINILSFSNGDLLPFRTAAFDSALGACLFSLCSSCQSGTIECIAQAFCDVMPQTVKQSPSRDLKVVIFKTFYVILKQCPSYASVLPSVLDLISIPGIGPSLICSFQLAMKLLGATKVAGKITDLDTTNPLHLHGKMVEGGEGPSSPAVSGNSSVTYETQQSQEYESRPGKRRRLSMSRKQDMANKETLNGEHVNKDMSMENVQVPSIVDMLINEISRQSSGSSSRFASGDSTSPAAKAQKEVLRLMRDLAPASEMESSSVIEGKLTGLSVLVQMFGEYSGTECHRHLTNLLHNWLPWIHGKAQEGSLSGLQLSMFLETVEPMVSEHEQSNESGIDSVPNVQHQLFLGTLEHLNVMKDVLLLPWSTPQSGQENITTRMKSCAVWIASRIGGDTEDLRLEHVLQQALRDGDEGVRSSAVSAIPSFVQCTSPSVVRQFCDTIGRLGRDDAEQVRDAVAAIIGVMACIHHSTFSSQFPERDQNPGVQLKPAFVCSLCNDRESTGQNIITLSGPRERQDYFSPLALWQHLFNDLLFKETSEQVQVSFIGCMSQILQHSTAAEIAMSKASWLECLGILPIHRRRGVREAFCSQIKFFTKAHVLAGIFGGNVDDSETNHELQMLGKLKHALVTTRDPDVLDTLIETIAEVANVSNHNRQLLFFSLVLLLEQLDSRDLSLRMKSVKLIHGMGSMRPERAGAHKFQSILDSVREELFEYLINRLLTRPVMIQEFAEAVLGISFEDLLKQMVPLILPKLVLNQQHSQQALDTLHELAKKLNTDLPLLLLEWCHKVLSVLLLRADGSELMAALQFYEMQTCSDPREIFTAVLPALLDELVRFLGDTDDEDAQRRSERVAPMIKEVASIVTGSDDLPTFLRGHFVGLLNSIDRKLLRAEDVISQKQALRCIERLVEMIGPHLSAFVPKIMALLTRALQDSPLQVAGLKVWLSFVRTLVRTSPTSARNVASQIVVALMPYLEGQDEEQTAVVEVLEELVLKNGSFLEDQSHELPILPSLPSLSKVNAVLQRARGSLSLRDQLRRASDGLTHESMSVRYMTGSELRKVMQAQRRDMTTMLAGESAMDVDVVSNLVTALLRGCGEESRTSISQRLKMACAECLGELGAVDPVKLQVHLRHQSRIERSNEELVFELINDHLARVLRAATDSDIQDAAALAIQELLKFSGCHALLLGRAQKTTQTSVRSRGGPPSKTSKVMTTTGADANTMADNGEQFWRRFTDDVKEIIAPCLTSKYFLKKSGASTPDGPIFKPGMSFRRWMYLWTRRLISQSTGQRAEIFIACTSVVRHDMGTALYLLPYLVLNVVCDGSVEARTSVTDEILAVLAEAASISTTTSLTGLESGPGFMPRGGGSGPSEVSTQTVFTLIDNLGQWLDDCKQPSMSQSPPVSGGSGRGNNNFNGNNPNGNQIEPRQDANPSTLHRQNVMQLLAAIPKQALAGASFRCQAYARALLYFETHVREKSGSFNPAAAASGVFADEDVTLLLEIYSGLDEPDGLSGLSRLRTSTNLQDQILINEKAGNWAEALTCCEQALQMEPSSVVQHSGVLDCLLNMGHLQAMVTHVDGLVSRLADHKKEWYMRGVQAAWRLGQWDLLEEYVAGTDGVGASANGNSEHNAAFDISLAKILQALQKKDLDLFTEQIMHSRQALLAPLAAASMESYTRAYPLIVKLHMLQELEDFSSLAIAALKEGPDSSQLRVSMTDLVEHWETRLKITQPSLWTREPILALRRLILGASDLQSEVGICWLQYAKLCRAAGHFETANRAILQAKSVGAPNAHMEMAKLLWDTKKSHRAISELQEALGDTSRPVLGSAFNAALSGLIHIHGKSPVKQVNQKSPACTPIKISTQVRRDKDMETAKTLLLLARWVHHTGQKQKDDVVSLYSRVKELQPKWEKGFFYMARYFDDLLADARRRQGENRENLDIGHASGLHKRRLTTDDKPWWNYLPDVMLFYAKSLHKGHVHLFQAMPRLLTLWFEFGSSFCGDSLTSDRAVKAVHVRVMGIVRGCVKDLPAYQWLTSLPQLVSRICHHNDEVVRLVKHVITTVLQAYPQQALWSMAAVTKSIVAARREAAAEILQQARISLGHDREKIVLFTQFAGLIDQMIRLCNYAGQPKAKTISLAADFGYLKRLMPVGVIMPLQKALTVTLPAHGLTDMDYNPFPAAELSTISGIGDEIEILASLQKPKKVVLLGSDGLEHPFLCKPKDDLRKDARMMEFTTMINRLLSKDPNSRRRKLYIRTFAVVPLSEDCGMIEWVLHTRGLRHILQDVYVACGKFDRMKTNPSIKRIYDQQQANKNPHKMSDADMLLTKVLPMFPPVFHRWFLNTFPEPATWFQARVAYAHTTAVWSMVGHMVGLGDRHGENILFDSTTGDCVHVDFSCLFDKGLQLEKPELVPFRLTQNMIDGLGITGYEGMFLRVCEITLSVLRSHRETLMSVLETFIHDPLVEWTKSHKSSGVEVQNPHAQKAIANIEARLEGVVVGVAAAPSLPLSVEGQVHRLIAEAVSLENLSKMYIWWMPWF